MSELRVALSEIFRSIQGEGPRTGRQALFVRLAGCNLACVWCDTQYAWNWDTFDRRSESRRVTVAELVDDVLAHTDCDVSLVVVTGGEPMLQQEGLSLFLRQLRAARPDVCCQVETNGTMPVLAEMAGLIDQFVVSPKLRHAGGPRAARIRMRALLTYAALPESAFKFVVSSSSDLTEIEEIRRELSLEAARVWLMPLAASVGELLETAPRVAELALVTGYNLSDRFQLLSWGQARGR